MGDDGVVGGKVETEQQLTRRVREAKKNYVLQSRAHKIHSLSEQIYDATQMPSRLETAGFCSEVEIHRDTYGTHFEQISFVVVDSKSITV